MAMGEPGSLGAIFDGRTAVGLGPAELLERFAARRDEGAFAALVDRHGPMVLATCRRVLPNAADADDAFQATFLVLARKARSIGDPDRLAPWLHGVAHRVAVRVRLRSARRPEVADEGQGDLALAMEAADARELRAVLDEELARLPAKYRDPLVLCYLDGLTHDEAAGQLHWPVGTVRSRLAGGRDRLRSRLTRRGFAPGALVVLSPASLPVSAVSRLLQAATVRLVCAGGSGAVATSAAAVLAQGVLTAMFFTKIQTAAWAILAVIVACVAGTASGVAQQQSTAPVSAPQTSAPAAAAAAAAPAPKVANEPALGTTPTPTPFTFQELQPEAVEVAPGVTVTPKTFLFREFQPEAVEVARAPASTPNLSELAMPQPTPANPARPTGAQPETLELAIRALAQDLVAAKARIDTLEADLRALRAEVRATRGQAGDKLPPGPGMGMGRGTPTNDQQRMMPAQLGQAMAQQGLMPGQLGPAMTDEFLEKYYTELMGQKSESTTTGEQRETVPRRSASRAQPTQPSRVVVSRANPAPSAAPGVSRTTPRSSETDGDRSDDDGPPPRTTQRRGVDQPTRATDFISMGLPGSNKLLVIPTERNQATVIDTGTNQRFTYRSPAGAKITPVVGGNVIGLQLQGPQITQAVAFSRTANQWYPVDLNDEIRDGLLNPIVSEHEVRYYVGRHLYFFNDLHKRWSTLTLNQPIRAGRTSAPGEAHEGSKTMIPEGETMHIYDSATGEWTHINLGDDK